MGGAASSCFAEGECSVKKPSIEVFGRASISVPADYQTWSVQVVNRGLKASDVANSHQEIVTLLSRELERLGVKKTDVKVGVASLNQEVRFIGQDREREFREVVARTRITFENRDVDRYSSLWIAISELQNVEIGYVVNESSQRIVTREEARKNALLAAKQKAEAMAAVLGVQVLDPISIQESGPASSAVIYGNSFNNRVVTTGSTSEELPGKVEIVEEVHVEFGIGRVSK